MVTRLVGIIGIIAAALVDARPMAGRATGADWTQWGGPGRNFMSDVTGLAASWPAGGPTRRWSRALGEGHASILAEGGRLYPMYRPIGVLSAVRRSQDEVVVALDATAPAAVHSSCIGR